MLVDWADTEQDYNWTDFASFESNPPPTMRSVGFLYEDIKGRVSIFQSVDVTVLRGQNGMFDSILTIPREQIKSITVIKKYTKKNRHEPKYTRK